MFSARAHGIAMVLWLAHALAVRTDARAQDPSWCSSNTTRDLASVVSTYGPRSTQALWIGRNETLCLRVGALPNSDEAQIQAVTRAPASVAVSISVTTEGGRTVLRVRNPFHRELRHGAAVIENGATRATYVSPIAAHSEGSESWNASLEGLVLYDFRLAVSGGRVVDGKELSETPTWGSEDIWSLGALVGATWNQLHAVNRDLRRRGFGTEDTLQPLAGLAVEIEGDWIALGMDVLVAPTRGGGPASPDVSQFSMLIQGGYRVATRELTFAPMLGFGFGTLVIDVNPAAPELAIDEISELSGDSTIHKTFLWFVASVGINYRLLIFSRDAGLVLGLRGGYLRQFDQTRWSSFDDSSGDDFQGGPLIDTSGPYVRLLVGYTDAL